MEYAHSVSSSLRLTREEIVQSDGDRVTSRLSANEEPTVGVISELLFSVLAGDFKRLQTGFNIEATTQADGWRTKLVPKESGMRRVIKSINLAGNDFVRQITMLEASGDQTAITFSEMKVGERALQPEESRAFGMGPGRGGPGF